jgi:hypothetical protein
MILFWEVRAALLAVVRLICRENLKGSAIVGGKPRWNTTSGTQVATSVLEAGPLSRFETGAAMRIVSAGGSINAARAGRRASGEGCKPDAPETESRALIAVEAPAPDERTPRVTRHPAAAFVAQLIATQMHAPQTRARRRAEPDEADAVYRSMTKPVIARSAFGRRA